MNIVKTKKQELRQIMRGVLSKITPNEIERQSIIVQKYLLEKHKKFLNAKHIAIYIAQKDREIDTNPIITHVLTNYKEKCIYVPHIEQNQSDMKFYRIKDMDAYENDMTILNKYKIRQFINVQNMTEIDPTIIDLVIVPGMAFCKSSNENRYCRIGRGKGYYDRFLEKIPNCYTIALSFNEQYIPNNEVKLKVPSTDKQDFEINELLCEKTIMEYKLI